MPPAPQQGGQSDNSSGLLWIVAAIFLTLGIVWYLFKAQIVGFYLLIKLYEVDLFTYLTAYLSNYFDLTSAYNTFDQLQKAILYLRTNPAAASISEIATVGVGIGTWLRIPFMILLMILALVVYLGNTTRVFTRSYAMRDLAKLEQVNWPQITPVVNLDLIKTDIDTGPWAMAMTPMQFSKKFKLLEEVRTQRETGRRGERIEVVLKRGEANKLFALQLGPLWKGVESLPPYTKALFAVFAARMNADTKPAADLLAQMSASCNTKLNFAGTDQLLKKHGNSKLVKNILESHAYVLTVMAAMLEGAREDGVQASSDFLWLKPIDRRLWYTLNTVGRQTPFIEVAGIFAHWVSEKEAGRKLLVPMVEEATNALELALKEVVYRRDEE